MSTLNPKTKALLLLSAAFSGLGSWAWMQDFTWSWTSFAPLLSCFAAGFLAGVWLALWPDFLRGYRAPPERPQKRERSLNPKRRPS